MWTCSWPAPAKLNLFLHVTGRRADGYHALQTLFQFVDFADALHFRVRRDGRIRRWYPLVDVDEDTDLTLRAARRLQAETDTPRGVDIAIGKHIPLGGGLGGGSSDAATALVALNALWECGLSPRRLAAIGLELGADVPVFVHGHAAWAEGVGEELTRVEPAEPWYLIIRPPARVSTAAIFAAPELTRDTPPITIRDFLAGAGANACEAAVRARHPAIDEALDWLAGAGMKPRLSGTGACVFGACPTELAARQARARMPRGWRAVVARGRNRSPLLARAATMFGP